MIKKFKNAVVELASSPVSEKELGVVWSCKTLQNYKAIFCVLRKGDQRLFECTFNGNEEAIYVDEYIKLRNSEKRTRPKKPVLSKR